MSTARELIARTAGLLENCSVTAGHCCCGASMGPEGYCDNHTSVDQGTYYAIALQDDIKAWQASNDWQPIDDALRERLVTESQGKRYWVVEPGRNPILGRIVGQTSGPDEMRFTDGASMWRFQRFTHIMPLDVPEPPVF